MMGLGVGGAGKYVPPSRKVGFAGRGESGPEGASNPMSMGEDHTKIRVTNISEDTTEGDLRDLFSAFGRINRFAWAVVGGLSLACLSVCLSCPAVCLFLRVGGVGGVAGVDRASWPSNEERRCPVGVDAKG